jgi:hypothetical protein
LNIPAQPYIQSIFYDDNNMTFFGVALSKLKYSIVTVDPLNRSIRLRAAIAAKQDISFGDARYSPEIRTIFAQCGPTWPTANFCSINVDTGAYKVLWPMVWEGPPPFFVAT